MQRTVTICSAPFVTCRTEIRVNDEDPIKDGPPITISVRSGACYLQTYATRDECRSLAAALLAVANEVPEAVPA